MFADDCLAQTRVVLAEMDGATSRFVHLRDNGAVIPDDESRHYLETIIRWFSDSSIDVMSVAPSAQELLVDLSSGGARFVDQVIDGLDIPNGRRFVDMRFGAFRMGALLSISSRLCDGAMFVKDDAMRDMRMFAFSVRFDRSGMDGDGLLRCRVPPSVKDREADVHDFLACLLALFALLATPKIVRRERADLRKLQAVRSKRGKAKLLEYSTIHLTKSAEEDHRAVRDQDRHDGTQRRFHFVRGFSRVRLGRVEIVRPHTRGSHAVGVMSGRKKVVA